MRFDSEQAIELPSRADKISMLLDLPDDSDELWQNPGSKIRAQVKRPIREGVEFLTGGQELLDAFYYVFSINMRDLGTPVYSRQFFREMLSTFSENIFIAIVRLNGETVGAGFLIGCNGKLEIPWASAQRKINRLGVNMFLYWNILQTAIEKNYKVFDFGRSSKDAGILKFKKQWGGYEKQLYWYYVLPAEEPLPGLNPENKKFGTAVSVWNKLPVKVINLNDPQVLKNLS